MSGVRAGSGPGPDVLTFGETMVALRGAGPLKLGGTMSVSVAGAESNVAVGLARLGHGASWAGAVGDDEAGELVLRTLRAEGVDVTGARRDPHAPTGLILFEPRLPEVTRVHYYRSGSAGSRVDAQAVARAFAAAPPRLLHLTGVTPALGEAARAAWEGVLRLAREHAVPVCLDVNFRSRLWSTREAGAFLRPWLPAVDVLVASADELPVCLPPDEEPDDVRESAERLLRLGVPEVVVKLGADGATAYGGGGAVWHRPAVPVRVVDTVGAGDAFVAGYLSALLDGADVPGRLQRAVTTGAFAVASRGDWEGAPTRAELGLLGAADVLR
ncbi:sugar kinase [Streptomyces sp. AN091965]|uniref:sugar kinase n=1 Tax=Streptomyces sp. AN091965 TaxID=2927803 RepID=UPI0027E3E80C|nr:sugar kinase [Streptomyces sp. AN091965]